MTAHLLIVDQVLQVIQLSSLSLSVLWCCKLKCSEINTCEHYKGLEIRIVLPFQKSHQIHNIINYMPKCIKT